MSELYWRQIIAEEPQTTTCSICGAHVDTYVAQTVHEDWHRRQEASPSVARVIFNDGVNGAERREVLRRVLGIESGPDEYGSTGENQD